MRARLAFAQLKSMNLTLNGKRRKKEHHHDDHNNNALLDEAIIVPEIVGGIMMMDDAVMDVDDSVRESELAIDHENNDDAALLGTDNHNDLPHWIDPNNHDFHAGFNVVHESKLMAMKSNNLPNDADEPLFPGSSVTKIRFCNSFQSFVAEEGLTDVASIKLLKLLKEWLPTNSNMPIQQSASGGLKSTVAKYVISAENRLISFDCCKYGHCVYKGCCDSFVECPQCKEQRFHPCTSRACQSKNVSYYDCSHPFSTRSAKYVAYYRPLLPLIKDLLSTKMFVKSLKYKHLNPYGVVSEINAIDEQHRTYSDIMDSELAVTHMKQMEERFQSIAMQKQGMVPINLLLGYNYDGCQPFNTKAADFWPMIVSILNLPPNLRKKVGMGMFLLSIYNMGKETYVEDFLHRDCFVRELLFLYDGYEMEVNDKIYFVQARLICHGYDTKAAEHVLRVQASGSLAGCPFCRLINGARKKWSGTVFFAGHRRLLPLKHFLRSRGQSQQCCPEGFYSANAPASLEEMTPVSEDWDEGVGLGCNGKENERKVVLNDIRLCCSSALTVKNFLQSASDPSSFVWYHETFKPDDFMGSLYYYHMDYRDHVQYSRVTNNTYIHDGLSAIESQSPCNGVKGLWLFRYLPYADFATQVNWDPFHTLMNVARNVISIWKGIRPVINDSLLAYCLHTKSHPELWSRCGGSSRAAASSDVSNKWKIPVSSVDELNALDRYFQALLVPKGFTKEFEAHEVFSQTGYMKGYTTIQFVEVLMDYFVYAVLRYKYEDKYPEQLMKFLILLSEDFAWLLSTNPFSDEDISNLFYRIVEVVELHQGLYPTSEALIIYHQLIDLPHHIRQLGPLRNWWTLSGERFMSAVKDGLPDGGKSYVTTVIRRHVNSELQSMKDYDDYDYYTVHNDMTISACNRHALFPSTFFNIVNDNTGSLSAVYYCERLSKLMMQDVRSGSLELNDYEFSHLLSLLVSEAPFICGSFMTALQNSPLFRLYCAFSQHKRSKLWTQDGRNKEMNKMDEFLFWLNNIGTNNGKEGLIKFNRLFINNNQPNYFSSIDSSQLRNNIVNRGMIYLSDWLFTRCLNENKALYRRVDVVYKKCLANGVMFNSRGQNCRERQQLLEVRLRFGQQSADIIPSNRMNLCLADHCGNVNDYSSWCRILYSDSDPADERFESLSQDTFEFGQLNCFFRCKLPVDEKVLNDIPIASISVRRTERRGRNLFSVKARDERSSRDGRNPIVTTLKPDVLFCAVYKIYPTPIIVAAMDNQMRPISKSSIIGRKEDTLNNISKLLLIQMHRHRTINFNPTFPNIATMQLLTNSCNDHP